MNYRTAPHASPTDSSLTLVVHRRRQAPTSHSLTPEEQALPCSRSHAHGNFVREDVARRAAGSIFGPPVQLGGARASRSEDREVSQKPRKRVARNVVPRTIRAGTAREKTATPRATSSEDLLAIARGMTTEEHSDEWSSRERQRSEREHGRASLSRRNRLERLVVRSGAVAVRGGTSERLRLSTPRSFLAGMKGAARSRSAWSSSRATILASPHHSARISRGTAASVAGAFGAVCFPATVIVKLSNESRDERGLSRQSSR